MKYFIDTISYPDLGGEILPFGTRYDYISRDFLNGFINKVEIIKIVVAGRYKDEDYRFDEEILLVREGDRNANIRKEEYTKKTLFDYLSKEGLPYHSDLSIFEDDVIILAKSQGRDEYWFFWYDMDVSDCSIGRFVPEEDETHEDVINEFDKFVAENSAINERHRAWILPTDKVSGWISF